MDFDKINFNPSDLKIRMNLISMFCNYIFEDKESTMCILYNCYENDFQPTKGLIILEKLWELKNLYSTNKGFYNSQGFIGIEKSIFNSW